MTNQEKYRFIRIFGEAITIVFIVGGILVHVFSFILALTTALLTFAATRYFEGKDSLFSNEYFGKKKKEPSPVSDKNTETNQEPR